MQQNGLVERALQRLLEEPFGPYLDKEVLSARCKSTKTSVLKLQQVMFEREDQAVAVNENDDVRFRGILALSSINQLSPGGVEYITSEIRHRFTEMRHAGTPLRHLRDNISVADLFRELDNWRKRRDVSNKKQVQDVPTVNVWVQGEKLMAVGYLTASPVPNGLFLPSMDHHRQYQVCSLEIRTYSLSRTYLLRWHTYRTMDDIVKLDKNKTLVENRTPEWFVDQYLRNFAYVPRYRFRRLLYDHDATDTESEDEPFKDADGDIAMLSATDLGYGDVGKVTRLPRHPRRVHKAEVYSLFASHVEWIVREQEVRTKKWLDLASWRVWRGQVQNQRQAAQKDDVRWGICDEQVIDEEPHDSDNEHARSIEIPSPLTVPHAASNNGRAGSGRGKGQDGRLHSLGDRDSDDEVERVMIINRTTSAHSGLTTSIQSGKPSSKSRKLMSTSKLVSRTQYGPGRPKKKKAKVTNALSHLAAIDNELSQNTYDTDFSEDSTTSASRSPSPSSLPCPIDPAIVSAIPMAFQRPPVIDSDLKWHCPVQHCDHVLDLMNLQQTNIKPLKRADIAFICSQEWKIGEKAVQMLYDMVSCHWEGHLREWGIKVIAPQDGVSYATFEWKKLALHKPWPPLEWTAYIKEIRGMHKEAEVKVEEEN